MKRMMITAVLVMMCCGITACTDNKTADTGTDDTAAKVSAAVSEDISEETPTEIAVETETAEKPPVNDVKKLADGIYSLDYSGDYRLDEYLESDVTTLEDMDRWFMENLTDGISTDGSKYDMACSSFAVTLSENEHIFGRNYDLRTCDAMFIRTTPEKGYSSIGIVDLSHLNIGYGGENEIDSEKGRSLLGAAPYCICDGINEKGLGVSLLELDSELVTDDTEKPDLLLYITLRALLDRCTDTDEAISFLSGYDIYSATHHSYHIFITDKSGRSVTVEWPDGGMVVVDDDAVTNFILFEAPPSRIDSRYVRMRKALDDGKVLSKDDAMAVLADVMQNGGTRWSAVYDLDSFTVEACFNGDYEHRYSFGGYPGSDLT